MKGDGPFGDHHGSLRDGGDALRAEGPLKRAQLRPLVSVIDSPRVGVSLVGCDCSLCSVVAINGCGWPVYSTIIVTEVLQYGATHIYVPTPHGQPR